MDEVVSGFRIDLSGAQGYYGINPILIFNNVSNWPVYATVNSLTDTVYVEVWNPYSTYLSIASVIKDVKKL